MRPADMHLTPQELQSLLFGATDSKTTIADSAAAQEAQQHLSGCAVCQSVANKYTKADSLLKGLSSGNKGLRNLEVGDKLSGDQGRSEGPKRGTDCPADETWLNLAAGLISEEEAARYVSHAAQCDWCGPLLKESMEDLAQDATAEEQEALDKLLSASPGWQRAMAKKMAASGNAAAVAEVEQTAKSEKLDKSREKAGFGWWPKLVWAGSGLAVVLVAVLVGVRLTREPDVNQLLAQAYTEQRTIELRMPGAKYGPLRVERGGEISHLNRPTALLDAEAIIAHKLSAQPESAYFLQMRGRAELLEWNYGAAIETFKHALDLEPSSLSAKTDLATAYFQRAEASDRAIDYGKTIELLGQVLAKKPDDLVALFNHAIASERMFLYHNAIADWEHFLQLNPTGQWADEARQRLDEDRKKVEDHRKNEPLLGPLALNQALHLNEQSTWNVVGQRAEEYLDVAIREWLPKIYSDTAEPNTRAALAALAFMFEKQHNDEWLTSILKADASPALARGVTHLAAAVENNERGDADTALRESRAAAKEFLNANQPAGYARAQLEGMYALHRTSQGRACLAAGRNIEREVAGLHFSWIMSQLALEQSVCSRLVSDQGNADALLKRALFLTSEHSYPGLQLRALSFAAAASRLLNADPITSWKQDRDGLSIFWKGTFPLLRGYSFYQDLAFTAENRGESELLYSLRHESADLDASMVDVSRHAIAHMLLAKAAALTGRKEEAESEFAIATRDLRVLKSANPVYRLFDQVQLAQLEGTSGQIKGGIAVLIEAEKEITALSNFPLQAEFFNTLGDLQCRNQNYRDASQAFQSALKIGQAGLKSFKSEAERIEWLHTLDQSYRGLVRVELGLNRPEDALAIWEMRGSQNDPDFLRNGFAPSLTASFSWRKPPISDVSVFNNLLPMLKQETVLSYYWLPEAVFIWAYDDRGVIYASVQVPRAELERTIRRFNEQCSAPLSDLSSLRENASKLYKWLIAPIKQKLMPQRNLVIELDDGLDSIPMQALVDDTGSYFGEQFSIAYSDGFLEYVRLKRQVTALDFRSVLVVSPSAPESAVSRGIFPSEDAIREAQLLSDIFPNADVLLGSAALWPAVQQRLRTASIFHFVGHALPDVDRTSLVFPAEQHEDNGEVAPASIKLSTSGRLQLVFLSACATAAKSGEGLADPNPLVSVFLRAKVPHVIATRWNIDSAASTKFVRAFYQGVRKGESVGSAAQHAAQSLLKENLTQHPHYWAAFAVFGRG